MSFINLNSTNEPEVSELDAAATTIQKFFRSYSTRRGQRPQPKPTIWVSPRLSPKATWVEWAFLLTGLCLEILSLAFDQASSPSKPQYALFGMILAIAAVLICIWELIYKGEKERVVLRRWGRLWWFYYPHSQHRLFGTLPDFYGLVGGISQCICSTVQYVCFCRHADNPIKVSLWPAIFLICLGAKRLNENRNEIRDEHED